MGYGRNEEIAGIGILSCKFCITIVSKTQCNLFINYAISKFELRGIGVDYYAQKSS